MQDILIRFTINTVGIVILFGLIYYPRYKHRETVVSASLFNIAAFAVLTTLSVVDFGLAAGFGLFAILALFTLRSEPISHTDMGYFFASISIAVISSINATAIFFDVLMILLVLFGAYVVDHEKLMPSVHRIVISLDRVPANIVANAAELQNLMSEKLGVKVISYKIISVCYVSEVVKAEVEVRRL